MDTWQLPYLWHIIALLATTALLYGSFQAGVSVLTTLSAHQLGQQRSRKRLLRLCLSYCFGALTTALALLFAATYLLGLIDRPASLIWAVVSGYSVAIGVVVLLFYYRSGKGTLLWLPRGIAEFLSDRARKTGNTFESFSLGSMTTIAELPFVAAPLFTIAMLFRGAATPNRVLGGLAFCLLATLPLLIIVGLVGSGKKISSIQKWREKNKGFLQAAAGLGLIIVGFYVFVSYCIGTA